jgi:hypothetical protein
MFTCEGCGTAYQPAEESAVARLYVKDSRCNHIEARCSHCGLTEVIYLGPNRIQEVLRVSKLTVSVFAEASGRLRVRAENAWAAAEEEADSDDLPRPVEPVEPTGAGVPGSYHLTPRHEKLLSSFGETLHNIPDELLWDGLHGEHRQDLPPRWVD